MAKHSTPKGPKRLERHFKGVANHRRIEILLLIASAPDITLVGIADKLKVNMKTLSEHTRRLALAGLVEKRHQGRDVLHRLTPYGRIFAKFIGEFSKVPVREDD